MSKGLNLFFFLFFIFPPFLLLVDSYITYIYETLKQNGINVTIRREFGGNIDAACGQLRAKEVER